MKSFSRALLSGLAAYAVGTAATQAATLVTFSVDMGTNILNGTFVPGTDTVSANGSFNGWSALNLVQDGSSTIYTNTANDTSDADGAVLNYKFVNSHSGVGYENTADGNNRAAVLPSGGGSLVLPTPFFGDAGAPITNQVTFMVDMTQQITLGNFTNDSSTVTVSGGLNGWNTTADPLTHDPSIIVTNQPGIVTSNVYVGTFSVTGSPNSASDYKFVENGNYEGTPTLHNSGNNRFFILLTSPQTNPLVYFNDAPVAPLVQVTFSVDMSVVALTDTNFNPASVTINGDLMGWGGVAMTNDPAASNTNIYTSPIFNAGAGSTINYQFRYTELSNGDIVYDHLNGANGGNDNRAFLVPQVTITNVPPVIFNDASLSDYLLQPTPVFFSVDMSWATTNNLYVGTNLVGTFNPSTDNVYINGQFANWYAWSGGATPVSAPPGYQMIEQGLSLIYTNTIVFPAGTAVAFSYKYGTDPAASLGGPADDEAGFGTNHYRVVRATALNPYPMPVDTFHVNMYSEPFFSGVNPAGGQLSVGAASGGSVPVTWLGRPGAQLQVRSDLTSGAWQTIVATDGTNWTSGYNSTNGFVSQTNWPAAGNTFFRLVKP